MELKQLLSGLCDNPHLNICFRFRCSGQMWYPNFTRALSLTDTGVTLIDATNSQVVTIHHLMDILQFEIDDRFQTFQPNFHYDVRPLSWQAH